MEITVITSTALNQHVGKAKQEASKGPVFITDRGRIAHVLLTIEDYQRIVGKGASIVESLAMPQAETVELEPSRLDDELQRIPGPVLMHLLDTNIIFGITKWGGSREPQRLGWSRCWREKRLEPAITRIGSNP